MSAGDQTAPTSKAHLFRWHRCIFAILARSGFRRVGIRSSPFPDCLQSTFRGAIPMARCPARWIDYPEGDRPTIGC